MSHSSSHPGDENQPGVARIGSPIVDSSRIGSAIVGSARTGSDRALGSNERTKRDIGIADDAFGEAAPELLEGMILAGRYLVLRRLGRGGFSDVFLAHDHELDRPVAIKRLLLSSVDPHFIKAEAKTLASLDHPGIVRIYDVCNDPQHGYLVIMQYVPGPLLREVLSKPISVSRAVEIAIRVSGGLIHAHSRGVIHRDIKPTNILMSNEGEPLIADFGLAFTPTAHCEPEGGTPRYMSPEQIRNETKRVGPSSDIFSAGILLYEMLAGRVPFNGATAEAISQATLELSPTPINTINAEVPLELDRIVRRALRKNVIDRYRSMEAFQADLIQWLNNQEAATEVSINRSSERDRGQAFDSTFGSSTFRSLVQFTHRGLQPFESDDAKLFLSLVPGPRAPSGLPESLQYWKDWMEGYDTNEYARVGIMYGPSGSGKTSLLRAGIVPHLAPDILPISLECQKGQSVAQFTALIAHQVDGQATDLADLLLQLRDTSSARGQHRKAVLVLDQFDNWAGSATTSQLTEFAAALRHCDGESLQALLIVRDDFWTSVTDFMHLVECGVEQWKNARSIELMDRYHAMRLLEAAGRGYGSLPALPESLDAAQLSFITQAIDEMSDKGRVLPIQLAMFAKMAKLQRWHPDTLSQAGGVQGAYIGYFQDLFESTAAPPSYQRVCGGVVEVLHCLLPTVDQRVHGHQVQFADLEQRLAVKKLQNQLHRVLNILVEDLRVVVRVSQPGSELSTPSEYAVQCNDRFHLVHDFLTVPIANWVDQVRKSSWRGRALARLEELSAMWNRKMQNRYLPTLPEFLAMQLAAPAGKRPPLQKRFLRRAGRKHLVRSLLALAVIASTGVFADLIWKQQKRSAELHRRQVVQKVETMIRGEASDFLQLMSNLGDDKAIASQALSPWLDSTDEKLRTRTRVLATKIHRVSFDSLMIDLGKIEPQLSSQVIGLAHECDDAEALLAGVCAGTSASSPEKIRAAIILAIMGNQGPLAAIFDYRNSPQTTSHYLELALDWPVDPGLWFDLALAEHSPGTTYHALCLLASFPEPQLPSDLPWGKIAALSANADPGVSSAAAWLIGKTVAARESIGNMKSGSHHRVLKSGLEQVRIDSGELTLAKPIVRVGTSDGAAAQVADDTHVRVEEPFWLSAAAVTNAEFADFLKESKGLAQPGECVLITRCRDRDRNWETDPGRAVTGLNNLSVLQFCNWLSRREGLQPAYEIVDAEPAPAGGCLPKFRSIEAASGFRLPTFSQIAYASGLGASDAYTPKVAVEIMRRSRSEKSTDRTANHFNLLRRVKDLMPNRKGVHFDLESCNGWTIEDGRIWSFVSTEGGLLAFELSAGDAQHLTDLWLVSNDRDPFSNDRDPSAVVEASIDIAP